MNQAIDAARTFLARYTGVWRSAWAMRKAMDSPLRSEDERAFLPAHLELIDTPVSPTARWTMRVLIAFFCAALLWACIGELDIVAVAPGRTVVDSRTKVVQPAETAVVRRILVRDGQEVRRGQLLIELDATATSAEYAQAEEALVTARLDVARLTSLDSSLVHGKAPALDDASGLPVDRIRRDEALVRSQFDTYLAREKSLQAVIDQRRAQLRTLRSTIGPMEASARITRARADDYGRLVEGKYVGRHEYLLREQERIAAERDLATQRNRLQEVQSSLDAAVEDRAVFVSDTRRQTLEQLHDARGRLAQLTPEVARTGQRDRLMALRAPVDGTVQQLSVHTVGGVVTPAQALLAVVPSSEGLEIEASVLNKDIGFVRPGQHVTVKVESFPYTRFGYLTGTVASVSRDSAQDERLGPVFPTRVALPHAVMRIDGVDITLRPGMALTVEIRTGRRRVIDYLFSPLRTHVDEAMRER